MKILSTEFGKETELEISQGKIHDYLGMILDFTTPGQLTVQMFNYINRIVVDLPKDMIGTSMTLATHHLFLKTTQIIQQS